MNEPVSAPGHVIGDPGRAAGIEGLPATVDTDRHDVVIDGGVVDGIVVRAASARGISHREAGTARQDEFWLEVAGREDVSGRWLIVAVADGVSAGPESDLAAETVTRQALPRVAGVLDVADPEAVDWDQLIGELAALVVRRARRESDDPELSQGDAARLMAATLVLVAVPTEADERGVRTCTALPLGDTSVWVLRGGGGWESVTAIKNDGEELAESATPALPLLPGQPLAPLTVEVGPADALFVMTDGIGDPLGKGTGEVGQVLAEWWRTPPSKYEFASQVDFARRSFTDDRTVVGLWFEGSQPAATPAGG